MSDIDFRPVSKSGKLAHTPTDFRNDVSTEHSDVPLLNNARVDDETRSPSRSTLIGVVVAAAATGGLISALTLFNGVSWQTTVRSWPREIFKRAPAESIAAAAIAPAAHFASPHRVASSVPPLPTPLETMPVARSSFRAWSQSTPSLPGSPLQPSSAGTSAIAASPNSSTPASAAPQPAPASTATTSAHQVAAQAPREAHVVIKHHAASASAATRKTLRTVSRATSAAARYRAVRTSARNTKSAAASAQTIASMRHGLRGLHFLRTASRASSAAGRARAVRTSPRSTNSAAASARGIASARHGLHALHGQSLSRSAEVHASFQQHNLPAATHNFGNAAHAVGGGLGRH